jgi:DNA-binding NarL/FixJ family response regulator
MKRKLSLLIVDDNPNFVRRMVSLLKEADNVYVIHTAHNYDEAFLLLDKQPDLALLDIHLPGKNGMHLLKSIKDSGKGCEVFMMTNSTGDYYREQCKKLGALRFFDKTNDFDLVPGVIKDFATQYKNKTANHRDKSIALSH